METPPHDLVSFGKTLVLPPPHVRAGQRVRLSALPGPDIDLPSGGLVVADPWYQEALPDSPLIDLGPGPKGTLLSTMEVLRDGESRPVTVACAAAIGPVNEVAEWRPLMKDGAPFELYPDSALGVFYDAADSAGLRPFFANDEHMFGIYQQALDSKMITMDLGGRIGAVVFMAPDGPALYPVYAGLDANARAISVLIDLKIVNPRRPWHSAGG